MKAAILGILPKQFRRVEEALPDIDFTLHDVSRSRPPAGRYDVIIFCTAFIDHQREDLLNTHLKQAAVIRVNTRGTSGIVRDITASLPRL